MAPNALADIPTVAHFYKLKRLSPSSSPQNQQATSKWNDKLSLIRTDLTTLQTDAIVNAANESLLGGGGVDGAIHRAAGPDLLAECETLNGCKTGSAKITDAYRLPCKKVIHAVGPIYRNPERSAPLLRGCYKTSLDLCAEHGLKSIAFSALSTGIYGYPSAEAAEVALATVREWLDADEARANKMERIVFCSFLEKDEKAYEKFVPKYFPPGSETEAQETTAESKGELLELPLPPTEEATESDQPELKMQKLDHQPVESQEGKAVVALEHDTVVEQHESGTCRNNGA